MNRNMAAFLALVSGLACGTLVRAADLSAPSEIAHALLPFGTLWLNALRMTLVPLMFAMVASGVFALDRSGGGGRLLGLALPLILALLSLAMLIGVGIGGLATTLWPVAPGTLAPASPLPSAAPAQPAPSLVDMLVALVPANPVEAASNGAMASVVVFAIVFGFAVSRTSETADAALPQAVRGLGDAMICIVHWVLRLTPIGIFMLSLGLALDAGLAVAGLVARMILLVTATSLVAIALNYALAILVGGVSPRRFARAALGAQAMAAGTCSSAATLPTLLDASAEKLAVPPEIGGAVLPLAVSIYRFGVPIHLGALLILIAQAAGVPLDAGKLLLCSAVLVLSNMGAAGLPGAAVLYASWAPTLQLANLPITVVPLLIAANALPDIFVTVANVTADLSLVTIVDRLLRRRTLAPATAPA